MQRPRKLRRSLTKPPQFAVGRKGRGGDGSGARTTRSARSTRLSNQSRAAALALATRGEVFDLGLTYSRRSFKWPGHSPGEIITFRSPDGVHRMKDPDAPPAEKNADHVYWHSAAMFISDNVATQIDGLAHITAGLDFHWYNGFKEAEWGGDWGPRKCDASDHSADRRARRAHRRGRLQESRRPAGPYR